jgi:hypothetical protein
LCLDIIKENLYVHNMYTVYVLKRNALKWCVLKKKTTKKPIKIDTEQIKNSNFINAGYVCYLFKTGSN